MKSTPQSSVQAYSEGSPGRSGDVAVPPAVPASRAGWGQLLSRSGPPHFSALVFRVLFQVWLRPACDRLDPKDQANGRCIKARQASAHLRTSRPRGAFPTFSYAYGERFGRIWTRLHTFGETFLTSVPPSPRRSRTPSPWGPRARARPTRRGSPRPSGELPRRPACASCCGFQIRS